MGNCMRSLRKTRCPHELPRFISHENTNNPTENMQMLLDLGYTRFKFMKQLYHNKAYDDTHPYQTTGPWANFAWDGSLGYSWHDARKYKTTQDLADQGRKKLGSWTDVHGWLFDPVERP